VPFCVLIQSLRVAVIICISCAALRQTRPISTRCGAWFANLYFSDLFNSQAKSSCRFPTETGDCKCFIVGSRSKSLSTTRESCTSGLTCIQSVGSPPSTDGWASQRTFPPRLSSLGTNSLLQSRAQRLSRVRSHSMRCADHRILVRAGLCSNRWTFSPNCLRTIPKPHWRFVCVCSVH